MARISRKRVQEYLLVADGADNHTAQGRTVKGRALEDLVCYLFGCVPGITITKRNIHNTFNSEEIDIAFWNEKNSDLDFLTRIILIECKNWSKSVGSEEVSWFDTKLRSRGLAFGILIAANGITGDPLDTTSGHRIVAQALSEGRQIVILTRREIELLRNTGDLVTLIQHKLCELVVSGTVFLE